MMRYYKPCPLPEPHTQPVGAMWAKAKGHRCVQRKELPSPMVPVEGVLIEHPDLTAGDIAERIRETWDDIGWERGEAMAALAASILRLVGGEETPSAADRVTRIGLDAGLDD
jgi:hypothetical protein